MKITRNLAIQLLSILLTSVTPIGAQASSLRCEAIFLKTDDRAFENLTKYEQLFTRGRGIQTYKLAMGADFTQSYQRLLTLKEGHWFDSGAGHAIAVRQTLEMPEATHLKSTVVAYDTVATSTEKLKVISGRFLESIHDSEIPKSDLITDVVGPMAYSGQPHLVLQKYLNNLKPDGEIYIFLGARHELFGQSNQVITAKGEVLTLGAWLEQLPGLKAELQKTKKEDDGTFYEMWTIRITKTQEEVNVPAVEMIHFKEGAPPTMTFKEVDNKGVQSLKTLQEKARSIFRTRFGSMSPVEFLDSFRGGEVTHPLISSLKSLRPEDKWVNSSEVGPEIFSRMQKKDYSYNDTSVFTGLAQKFIRWRSMGINTNKMAYTALSDSSPLKDVTDVKLITDYNGDFVSSFTPDVVLQRYLNALSNKGEVYLFMGKEYGGFGSDSKVMTKDGRKIALRQWLREIPGLSATLFRGGYHWLGGEWAFIKIKIKNRDKIVIPKLKLTGTTENDNGLPIAFFEEI